MADNLEDLSRQRALQYESDAARKDIDINYREEELNLQTKYTKGVRGLLKLSEEKYELEKKRLELEKESKKLAVEKDLLEKKLLTETNKSRKEELSARIKLIKKQQEEIDNNEELLDREQKLKKSTSESLQQTVSSLKQITGSVQKMLEPWSKIDAAVSKFANSVGISSKGMQALRKNTIDTVVGKDIAAKFNMGADELISAQQNFVDKFGRNIRQSADGLESFAAMSKVMGVDTASDMAAAFENFGVNVQEAGNRAGKMFSDASAKGISASKYSKMVVDNFALAQKYTFKDGLKGLQSMALKAAEVNFNMQAAAGFADSLMERGIEGAVETGAKLQLLGGPFAAMADPLAMLNEGMNDLEGLQDRMKKMFGSLGSLDKATGEVKVSSFNKLRIRQAASAMGMSYDDAMKFVNTNTRRGEIEKQIAGQNLNKDFEELIKNTGTFQNGVAGINTKDGFKSISDLKNNTKLQEQLVNESKSESENIKDIAQNLRSITELFTGTQKQKDARQAQMTERMGGNVKKLISDIGTIKILISAWAALSIGGQAINAARGFAGVVRGLKAFGSSLFNVGGGATAIPAMGNKVKSTELLLRQNSKGQWIHSANGRYASKADIAKFTKTSSKAAKGAKIAKTASKVSKLGTVLPSLLGTGIPGLIALGTALAVGGTVAAVKARQKVRNNTKEELGLSDLNGANRKTIRGGYTVEQMKQISAARITGNADDKLMSKIARNGDAALYEEIIAKKEEKASLRAKRKFNEEGIKVSEGKNGENIGPNEIKIAPVEVKLSGSFRIEGLEGMETELKRALLKDPIFIKNISKMISEQIKFNTKFANEVERG